LESKAQEVHVKKLLMAAVFVAAFAAVSVPTFAAPASDRFNGASP